MKKFFALVLLLICLTTLHAQNNMAETIEHLISFYPAQENSDNEAHVQLYIKNRLKKAGISHWETSLDTLNDCHSFSKNIYAEIPGKSDKTLVIATPVTGFSKVYSVALALDLADRFSKNLSECNIRILFLGAEFGQEKGYPIGSRVYIDSHSTDDTVLYLNFNCIPKTIMLQTGNRDKIAPFWMVENSNNALLKSNLKFDLKPEQNILYNLGMNPLPSPLDVYLGAGMDAIMLSGDEPGNIDVDQWSLRFYNFVREFSDNGLKEKENVDTNYLIVHWNNSYRIITESFIISCFLVIIGIIILYIMLHTKQARNYVHLIAKNIRIVFRTTVIVFILLMASTWLTAGLLHLSKLDTQWQKMIPELLSLKTLICIVLFVSILPVYSKHNQSYPGSLYSGVAIISALLNMLLFMVIEFSLAIFFVWSMVCTILFAIVRRKKVKFLCMMLSGLFFYLTVHSIIFYPAINLCREFIFSSLWTNVYLTIVILPFIFMGMRIFHAVPQKKELSLTVSKVLGIISLIFFTVLILRFVFIYTPYNEKHMQPVRVYEVYDLDDGKGFISLESNYKLGSLQVITGDDEFNIFSKDKSLRYDIQKPHIDTQIWASTNSFLERKTITMHINSEVRTDKLHITLTALRKDDNLIILDSTYPYEINGNNISFFIGKNQPIPFDMSITTKKDCQFEANIELIYSAFPFKFSFVGDNQFCIPSLVLKKRLFFKD